MVQCNLPRSIKINGKILKPVVGKSYKDALKEAKLHKKTYRTIRVLHKNLRGRLDLHQKPYEPTVWLFTN
jgi:hypothetical protein